MLLKNFTLLYVEDNHDAQDIMKVFLEDEVKEFYQAYDGKEGLSLCKDKNPDIIISDISMPVMDGIEMSKEIKEINKNQPILLFSAFQNIETLTNAINIGIDKFIPKPIEDMNNLLEMLESIARNLQNEKDVENLKIKLIEQSRLTAKGEMISMIAHQWRQPLNILGLKNMSLKLHYDNNKIDNNFMKKHIQSSSETIEYMSDIISDFKDFFKPDKEREIFNIYNAVKKSVNLISDSFKNHNIICTINGEDDIDVDIDVDGYKNEFLQVILNLITNAKDALIENDIKDKKIIITLKKENTNAVLTIKDNAGGIPENIKDKIFDPYFSTKEKKNGTGIGLYMVKMIIEEHMDGKLSVSNDEEGAVFSISF